MSLQLKLEIIIGKLYVQYMTEECALLSRLKFLI